MTSRRLIGGLLVALVAYLAGVASAVGTYLYANRDTVVYTATAPLNAEGIHIPAGTELVHHATMSEGFDTLKLYINVHPSTLQARLEERQDPRSFLIVPYWVEALEHE